MVRRISLSMPLVDPVLDPAEASLVERTLAWLRETCPRDSSILWGQLKRLALLGEALEQAPSLYLPLSLGGSVRDEATLVTHLAHLDPFAGELALPERAVVGRAFLMSKISLLRAFLVALDPRAPGANAALAHEFSDELAQSIYTAIASEILVALLGDSETSDDTKARAARQLLLVWERAVQLEIDDFCPMLESAWQARSHLATEYGALLGTAEYLKLVRAHCSPQFLDYFTSDRSTIDELQAFDEFLFNLTHEDLIRVRGAMHHDRRSVADPAYVAEVLQRPLPAVGLVDDSEALYRSYRRRRTAAEFRRITNAPGPRRVAEAYLMIYILDQGLAAPPILAPP